MIRISLAPVLLVVTLGVVGCGSEETHVGSSTEPIILGGSCATDPPGAVAILLSATAGTISATQLSCAGTLIAPDVVLTAGHCVQVEQSAAASGLVLKEIRLHISAAADLSMFKSQPQTAKLPADAVEVSWRSPHPQFDMSKLVGTAPPKGLASLHDIGVMFLSRSVTGLKPAVVVSESEAKQLALKTPLRIVGWGRTSAQKPSPLAPSSGGTRVCGESFINEIGPWEIQVGGDISSPRKCQGDSGGPSYATVASPHDRKDRVVGVTSRAYDSAKDCTVGGIDTRVDPHLGWLDQVMREGCAAGKRVWCEVPGVVPAAFYDPPAPEADAGSPAAAGDSEIPLEGEGGCRVARGRSPALVGWLALVGLFGWSRRRGARSTRSR